MEEAALLQAPVSALRARLAQLLLEWPEHPVLLQLHAICDRLTGWARVRACVRLNHPQINHACNYIILK